MTLSDAPSAIPILSFPPPAQAIAEAARALAEGKLIGLATETVFGIAADAAQASAVDALFEAKGRNLNQPLQLLVPDLAIAELIGQFSESARKLAREFWPGPLTLVVPVRHDAIGMLAPRMLAGGENIGIRIPNHPVPLALLHAYGAPVAASSANRSGQPPAHSAREAADALGDHLSLILDGPCEPESLASTVIDVTHSPPRILRMGALGEQLGKAL